MAADPWELLREARDSVALDAEAAGNSRFAAEAERVATLLSRIDAALAEYDNPTWKPKSNNSNIIEAHTVETYDRVLSVERMTFRVVEDGVGYWARVGNSNINCYDTQEEAKAACLRWYREHR